MRILHLLPLATQESSLTKIKGKANAIKCPFLFYTVLNCVLRKNVQLGIILLNLNWTELSIFFPSSDSELQIALVALFSEMLYRFPNVVVAHVTRESVQQAIANGITAQQVCDAC